MKKIVKDSVTQAATMALSSLVVELIQKWIASMRRKER